MQELVPTGKLRVGVAYAPSPTPVFVAKDVNGTVRGVPLDIGTALAKALGVPVELIVAATTGELTDACSAGAIDVGFMPADDERRQRVDFDRKRQARSAGFSPAVHRERQTRWNNPPRFR